jgi:CHASE2 domain-containing sensor protein
MTLTNIPKIFISYRRADSITYADLIYQEFAAQIGKNNLFYDVEAIQLGDKFADIIEERVNSCDVLLAIIGPKWLTISDDQGRRRIGLLDDYVHHEIATALSNNIRTIPVVVGGAQIPTKEDLPGDIADLSIQNAWEVRDVHLDQDIEALVAKTLGYSTFQDAFNILVRKSRLNKLAMMTIPAIVLVMFFAAWVQLFDLFTLDTKIESYSMALGSLFKKSTLRDDIVTIAIDEATERSMNKPFDKTWRREHAYLIKLLSKAGAKAIVFDIFLDEPSPYDDDLAKAIESARSMGVAVIFATAKKGNSVIPQLQKALTGIGLACAGVKFGYATALPLAIKEKPELLSLAVLATYQGGKVQYFDEEYRQLMVQTPNGQLKPVRFSAQMQISGPQKSCPALEDKDTVAFLIIEFRPLKLLREPGKRYKYEEVFDLRVDLPKAYFEKKIVLVGRESGEDRFFLPQWFGSEQRYGFEIQADTVYTMLNGTSIHPLGICGQFIIMLCMAVLGAYAQLPGPLALRVTRRWYYTISIIGIYLALVAFLFVNPDLTFVVPQDLSY